MTWPKKTIAKTILETCDIWDTDYNSDSWEPEFMTIIVIWQLRVTVDSICNSCDVSLLSPFLHPYFAVAICEDHGDNYFIRNLLRKIGCPASSCLQDSKDNLHCFSPSSWCKKHEWTIHSLKMWFSVKIQICETLPLASPNKSKIIVIQTQECVRNPENFTGEKFSSFLHPDYFWPVTAFSLQQQ